MNDALAGKRILVTQAAEFMGPALCRVFAAQGGTIVASTDDLVPPAAPEAIVRAAGPIDVLVANLALAAPSTSAVDADDDEWRRVFAALVDPLPRLVRAAARDMIARRRGKILVIGSASALRGMKRASTYSAARGGAARLRPGRRRRARAAQRPGQRDRPELRGEPDVLPAGSPRQPEVPGAPRARSPARPPRHRRRGRRVRRVPVQRGGRLLRRPGLSRQRRVGGALTVTPR